MQGDTSFLCRNHQTYVQETKDETAHNTGNWANSSRAKWITIPCQDNDGHEKKPHGNISYYRNIKIWQ